MTAMQWPGRSGLSPDSVTYLDPARSLAEGRGLTHTYAYWDPVYGTGVLPTRSTLWPPGFALATAALARCGLDVGVAGRVVPLLGFALLPVPLYGLLRLLLRPVRALGATAVATTSFTMVALATEVASEMPFTLMATLALWLALKAWAAEGPGGRRLDWALASAAAGGAFLFRYVGIGCLAGVVLCALVRRPRSWVAVALSSVPGGLIVAAVAVRNWLTMGTPTQPLPRVHLFWSSLGESARGAIGEIIGWKELLGPHLALVRPREAALLAALIGAAAVAAADAVRAPRDGGPTAPLGVSVLVAVFLALSLGVTLGALMAVTGQVVEPRYVLVYLPWVLVLVAGWALQPAGTGGGPVRRLVAGAAGVAATLWIACQLILIARYPSTPDTEDYVSPGRDSAAVAWIRAHLDPRETVLTNRGAELAYWCPNPVLRLPRLPHSTHGVTTWRAVDDLAARTHAHYLVHVPGFPPALKYDRAEFDFVRGLDDPARFPERWSLRLPDAVVYAVGPR
jgi:hypothetical protein